MSDRAFLAIFVLFAIIGIAFWFAVGYAILHILAANGVAL